LRSAPDLEFNGNETGYLAERSSTLGNPANHKDPVRQAPPDYFLPQTHSDLLSHSPRRQISDPNQRDEAVSSKLVETMVTARASRFRGIAAAPEITAHVVAKLDLINFIHRLSGQAAVANYFAAVFQQHR